MGAVQILEQVGRVPCSCSGQWETTGHHRVTLTCRLAWEVLPLASKGLFCCKGGYCCYYYILSSSNVAYKAVSAVLMSIASCISTKQQNASKPYGGKCMPLKWGWWDIAFVSFLLSGWGVTSQGPSWGWTWCSGCCWVKYSMVKVASTKDWEGGIPAPSKRNISLAPTRHPTWTADFFFYFFFFFFFLSSSI